jgi:putative tryptophan/tyrosine transport system substrate-binding protein
LFFSHLENISECSDPTSTGTSSQKARRNKPMKEKVAVSVIVALILASFRIAEAQQPSKAMPTVGLILSSGTAETPSRLFEAFRQGLRDLGYVDEKNVLIERRYAEGRLDRMPEFVNEFVQKKVDVILGTSNVVIRAAKEATKATPIVMISSVDPVAAGYVESFARPGGNITGLAWLARDLSAKRVELLKDLLPKMSRVGALWDAGAPGPKVAFKEYTAAARAFNLDLRSIEVRGANPDFVAAFHAANLARTEALIVVGNPIMSQHMKTICDLATKHRLPSMTEEDRYVEAGALISYGANLADLYKRAAGYVVEILKGVKPGDLPVKLPSKFDIFVNLKTAQQIGVVIPQHLLVQADKVIKD